MVWAKVLGRSSLGAAGLGDFVAVAVGARVLDRTAGQLQRLIPTLWTAKIIL